MTKRFLNQISISDIHLFHERVRTIDICDRLRKVFPADAELAKVDIIWIPGDVFDRLQMAPSDDVAQAKLWICDFLRACKACDVRVRVMEGTPLHDRRQSRMFETLNESAQIYADVRYIPELSIEHIEDWDLHVLYVPDQHRPDPDDTWRDVQDLLASHGLKQVDYALMHGCFEYQLPEIMRHICHKAERYLSIVKRFIYNGHHHTHTRYKRILVQGSFDRLKAGEEEAKGYLRVYEDLNESPDEATVTFCENKDATPFKMFVLEPSDAQTEEDIELWVSRVSSVSLDTRITVKYHSAHHLAVLSRLKAVSRDRIHSIKFEGIKPKASENEGMVSRQVVEGIQLTSADMVDGLRKQMESDGIDVEQQQRIMKQFKEMLHESRAG